MHASFRQDGAPTLGNEPVQVLVVRPLNPQVSATDVVDGLIVDHETAVGMFKGSVRGEDGVVRLHDGRGHLRSGIDTELQLAFLAIVHRQAFHEEGAKARSCAATERMEDQKSLETGTIVGHSSNLVQDLVNELLADCVVAARVVIRRVFLPGNHVLRMEQAAVHARSDLIDHVGLEVAIEGARHIFALAYRHGEEQVSPCERPGQKGKTITKSGGALTRLGEKGTEALIVICSFPLLGQVSIRLMVVKDGGD